MHYSIIPSLVALSMYTVTCALCIQCLLTTLLQSCLEPKPEESMPHHLPFIRPGAEKTDLGALYLRVRKVMVGMHERRAKMKSLIHIAEEW